MPDRIKGNYNAISKGKNGVKMCWQRGPKIRFLTSKGVLIIGQTFTLCFVLESKIDYVLYSFEDVEKLPFKIFEVLKI